jgi:hypothetical protein
MDIGGIIRKAAGLLLILVVVFYVKGKIEKKIKGPGGTKWRLRIGLGQIIMAVLAYIWARKHSPYAEPDQIIFGFFKGNWLFGKEAYIAVLIAIVILALVGVGDVVIGILSSPKEVKKTKE